IGAAKQHAHSLPGQMFAQGEHQGSRCHSASRFSGHLEFVEQEVHPCTDLVVVDGHQRIDIVLTHTEAELVSMRSHQTVCDGLHGADFLRLASLAAKRHDVCSHRLDAINHAIRLPQDRKSTRLNSSHVKISYAVFC